MNPQQKITVATIRGIGAFLADNAEEVAVYVDQALNDMDGAPDATGGGTASAATTELPRVRDQVAVVPFPVPDGARVAMTVYEASSMGSQTVEGTFRRQTLAEATASGVPDDCLGYAVAYIYPPRRGGLPLRKGESIREPSLWWDGRAFRPGTGDGMVYRIEISPLDPTPPT